MDKNLRELMRPSKIIWTTHAKFKMAFYGLSENRVRRVLKTPLRTEEGIAEKTGACMQPSSYKFKNGKKSWSQEIWVMFTNTKNGIKIISAWRYPGITKPRAPFPDAILAEIDEGLAQEE